MTGTPARAGRSIDWITPIGFFCLVLVVALVGAAFSSDASAVYAGLDRPSWAPPSWLFGPAWTLLYLLIAISGWLAWRAEGPPGRLLAFTAYGVQLVLNVAWTPLFFGLGAFFVALLDIILLLVAILATVLLFLPRSRFAAALLLPYLGWVGYATALTAAVL